MATVRASLFTALDGVVDPGVGNWHFPYFNEEMGNAVDGTHDADVMLFGRVRYDSFAGAGADGRLRAGRMPRSPSGSATCARSSCHARPGSSAGATRSFCRAISWTPRRR